MTNKSLQKLLNDLNTNNKKTNSLFYLRPLSLNVDFAKIWISKPKMTDNISSADGFKKFYLIKNSTNFYIAVVLDMYSDLHWYVSPEFRNNGFLINAMKEVILSHLFLNRDEQRITVAEKEIGIDYANASSKIALKLGFIKGNDNEFFLSSDKYASRIVNLGDNTKLSEERMIALRNEINYLGRSLWTIQTEIEMKLGLSDFSEDLSEMVQLIRSYSWKFEQFYRKNQQ